MYIGNKVNLRELRLSELENILKYVNDYDNYSSFTDSAPVAKIEEFQKRWLLCQNDREDIVSFAIADKDSDAFIGTCQLRAIDLKNYCATLSIIIAGSHNSGKGYGYDAVMQLLRFGFYELNLNRIQLDVYDDNISAIKLYEKCGFKKEGIKSSQIYRKGNYSTQIVYSILRKEFIYDI